MRAHPYLLNNNDEDESITRDESNFRRIQPKKLYKNVTLLPGDIIATPKHTLIFDKWIEHPEILTKEGNEVCMN